jgi:recyclin-1
MSMSLGGADGRYRMFEVNMDEYLEEETECIKQALDSICKTWDQQVRLLHPVQK